MVGYPPKSDIMEGASMSIKCLHTEKIKLLCFATHLSFSALSFANIRSSLLLFLNSLAFRRAYFLRAQLGKHQPPLLLFRRLMFSTSTLAFSHQTLIHSTQLLLFLQQIFFPLLAFAEGYNARFTGKRKMRSKAKQLYFFRV